MNAKNTPQLVKQQYILAMLLGTTRQNIYFWERLPYSPLAPQKVNGFYDVQAWREWIATTGLLNRSSEKILLPEEIEIKLLKEQLVSERRALAKEILKLQTAKTRRQIAKLRARKK